MPRREKGWSLPFAPEKAALYTRAGQGACIVRVLLSLIIGAVVGLGIGLFLGWVQFPAQPVDSPASALTQRAKDDWTVMVARAYAQDGDLTGAFDRLRPLAPANVPLFVQDVTERTISASGDVSDIRALVALSAGLGRLTPLMEPYQQAQGGSS